MNSPVPSLTPSVYSDASGPGPALSPTSGLGPSSSNQGARPLNVKRRSTGTISSVGDGLGYYFSNSAGLGPASSSSASSISLASSSFGGPGMVHSYSNGNNNNNNNNHNGSGPGGNGMVFSGSSSSGSGFAAARGGASAGMGLMKSQSHTNLKEILQDSQDTQDVTPRMDDRAKVEGALPLPRAPKSSRPHLTTRPSDSSSAYSEDEAGPSSSRAFASSPLKSATSLHGPVASAFDSPASLPSQYSASSSTSPRPHYFSNSAPPSRPARSPAMIRTGTDDALSPASEESPGLSEFRHLYTGNEAVQHSLSSDFADSMSLDERQNELVGVGEAHSAHTGQPANVRGSVVSAKTERPASMLPEAQQRTPRTDEGFATFQGASEGPSLARLAERRGTDAASMLSVDSERRDSRVPPSPSRSPAPPPRSALRGAPGLEVPTVTSPLTISPRSSSFDLPYEPSSTRSTPLPPTSSPLVEQTRPRTQTVAGTVPVPRPVSAAPGGTISELTDMLGGAIDEIGLIDSRETPPPTVLEPHRREKPANLSLTMLAKSDESPGASGPLTPGSLPSRANSLSAAQAMAATPVSVTPIQPPQADPRPVRLQRMQSAASFATDATTPSVRSWPQAMISSPIRQLRTSGERAKAYSRALNELAKADSGLCGWCIATSSRARMPHDPSQFARSAKSVSPHRSIAPSSYHPPPSSQQGRSVSSSSEFPMREDSYTAREISVRELEPSDRPSALPPNLPYPQLQQPARLVHASMGPPSTSGVVGAGSHGTLRPSQSMQSVASVSTTIGSSAERVKKSFFSGLKKGKKDSISLGPPNALSGLPPKKDVRSLAISAPTYGESAARGSSGLGGVAGPKGPRGSYTPPPFASYANESRFSIDSGSTGFTGGGAGAGVSRASLDSAGLGYARHAQARGSLESIRTTKSTATGLHGSSPLVSNGAIDYGQPPATLPKSSLSAQTHSPHVPTEQEVSAMSDILPHVEKHVIRSYISKYGDQMSAIGAYLEDEQQGRVGR